MIARAYPLKLYLKAPVNWVLIAAAIVLNLLCWVWLFWQIKPQEELIFLHYNILFGIDYVGERIQIAVLPFTGAVIILVNATLGWFLFDKDKLVGYLLNATSVICHIFLLISAALLVFLNV